MLIMQIPLPILQITTAITAMMVYKIVANRKVTYNFICEMWSWNSSYVKMILSNVKFEISLSHICNNPHFTHVKSIAKFSYRTLHSNTVHFIKIVSGTRSYTQRLPQKTRIRFFSEFKKSPIRKVIK